MFEFCTWSKFDKACKLIAKKTNNLKFRTIYGIPRGGLILAVRLAHLLNKQVVFDRRSVKQNTLVVDDICDTGQTLRGFAKLTKLTATIYYNSKAKIEPLVWVYLKQSKWVIFPWEQKNKTKTLSDMLTYYTGLDPLWVAGVLYRFSHSKLNTLCIKQESLKRKLSQFFRICGISFKLKNNIFYFTKQRQISNFCKKYGYIL